WSRHRVAASTVRGAARRPRPRASSADPGRSKTSTTAVAPSAAAGPDRVHRSAPRARPTAGAEGCRHAWGRIAAPPPRNRVLVVRRDPNGIAPVQWSLKSDLNRRPALYESAALPLSYSGRSGTGKVAGTLGHGKRGRDRKSTRLNSSHVKSSYAVFCLKKKR